MNTFSPPFWIRNPHLQTLWPKFFRTRPSLPLRQQRLELSDGDFIDLSWVEKATGPVILFLHGLEGTLSSHYALPVMDIVQRQGFCPVFMHLRGTSTEPNRTQRTYHSGSSDDLDEVLTLLAAHQRPVTAAIGFSLGANLLLKYLGEQGAAAQLTTAIAVSVPFVLQEAAQRLEQGASRLYQSYLLNRMKRRYQNKFPNGDSPLHIKLGAIRSLRDYDQHITAPLNGFAGAKEYYQRCSARGFLHAITVPTLVIHAQDDPFMYPSTIPTQNELGPGIELSLQPYGGHVGFIEGGPPWKPRYLLDRLIPEFLNRQLQS